MLGQLAETFAVIFDHHFRKFADVFVLGFALGQFGELHFFVIADCKYRSDLLACSLMGLIANDWFIGGDGWPG